MIIALQTLVFFRESLLAVLDRWLPPLFSQLFLKFSRSDLILGDDGSEDQVFSDFDDERGVVFVPPVHAQRYAAVCDCLMDERWYGKLDKVVNMGKHHDMAFVKYLTEVPGITQILGVNIESSLHCSSDLLDSTFESYRRKREMPLVVTLLRGNAADPDYRLIGCDAVIAIEMIEYMLPQDLDRLVHNLFGFIKPWIVVFTTTNADFNVLFKSLEKNGMRRLDHYFEWTRTQLHDWCSNIVARYPAYTVSCRGVGPGPPGTLHYGCCSQLVLFVSRDYHKQMELNVNSLALVNSLPQPNHINDFINGWESPPTSAVSPNTFCGLQHDASCSDIQYTGYCSCHSTLAPSFTENSIQFEDKAAQCNLDTELGKSFVMFNVEEMYEVVRPRRRAYSRVYDMEDVANRLNNTMFEVKKFSKTTQNLMAKNKIDSLIHTREVMDEICHLTKMLNFNCLSQGVENYTWCNINWGENAPYWNQYYKVLAVYNYPYEEKDEDSLILDLISDEINRLLDLEYDEGISVHVSKLEIPIDTLMNAVKHITEDVDRIIDLMEYNGYEVDGDVVVHSRIVEDGSMTSRDDDWLDETYSDCDTADVNSTSVSEGSNAALDFHARCLRRALDRKVRKLRTMFTRDEDISKELNHVVCRLVKIALSRNRGRQAPVPSKWLQCKLLDLLTLTEKAIVRRKIKFIEDYPLKALGYESQDEVVSEATELCRIKEDDTATRIVEKYRHLVQASDNTNFDSDNYDGIGLEDDLSSASREYIKMLDSIEEGNCANFKNINGCELLETPLHKDVNSVLPQKEQSLPVKYDQKTNRTQDWVKEDQILPPYSDGVNEYMISSGDDHSFSKGRSKRMKLRKKHISRALHRKSTKSKSASIKFILSNVHKKKPESKSPNINYKVRSTKINTSKKDMKAKTSYKNLVRKLSHKSTSAGTKEAFDWNYKCNFSTKANGDLYPSPIVQRTVPRPIPDSIIKLCHPEQIEQMHFQEESVAIDEGPKADQPVAATKNSVFIQIVTAEEDETVAMRRSIGTDAGEDSETCEQELEISNVVSMQNEDTSNICPEKLPITTENVHSQTIFLYDINEPSTSKGVRHVSMDVQCGTDAMIPNYEILSTTTSLTTLPKMFSNGIKIGDSFPDIRADKTSDNGTSTNDNNKYCMSPRINSFGIKIKDSGTLVRNPLTNVQVNEKSNLNYCVKEVNQGRLVVSPEQFSDIKINAIDTSYNKVPACYAAANKKTLQEELNIENMTVTETLKQVSSQLKIESCSEFNSSFCSLPKAALTVRFAKNGVSVGSPKPRFPMTKYTRPKLSCGGVHVHSYRDRQDSEDVVYQGEWQQYRPVLRKKAYNTFGFRKNRESIVKKAAGAPKSNLQVKPYKDTVNEEEKVIAKQVRYTKLCKSKEEVVNKPMRKKSPSAIKIVKPILKSAKNVTKVSSKIGMDKVSQIKNSKTTVQIVRRTKSMSPVLKKESKDSVKTKKMKCYIPLYLKKMTKKMEGQKLPQVEPLPDAIKVNQEKQEPMPLETKVDEMKTDLLKVYEPRENISYVVFRNEIDNSKSGTTLGGATVSIRGDDRGNVMPRAHSPASQNSSSCSSPNSVATVRAVPTWPRPLSSKRHSTPNTKSNVSHNASENKMLSRNRKFKNITNSKKDLEKDINNKENLPESSKDSNLIIKDTDRVLSGGLIGKQDNSFTRKILSDNMQASNRSSIKMPVVKSNGSLGGSDENFEFWSAQNSNMVVLLESNKPESVTMESSVSPSSQSSFRIVDNKVLSEWIASPNRNIVESHTSNILAAMKQLVEESLDFVDTSDNFVNIDSKTVVLSREGSLGTSINEVSVSPSTSFKTVINNVSETFHSVIDNLEHDTINDSAADRSVPSLDDLDLLSFKSAPSISKFSDCFADNESYDFNPLPSNSCAVRGIFERKETILTKNAGALATQEFSGFSINAEPVAGDQPDYVNLIDSETGSAAYDPARLAASEELFVSGRSESFASCLFEEDSVVPNWLFQIISQQQSINLIRSVPDARVDPALPLAFEVDLDENGNEAAPAAGAGAGDGRGMHSDQSQDSSGRGSSLTTSATSSGAQSEAIIIDPTAFAAQFEMFREAYVSASPAAADLSNSSARTTVFDSQTTRSPNTRQHSAPAASDADADVSSIDSDVPSDN